MKRIVRLIHINVLVLGLCTSSIVYGQMTDFSLFLKKNKEVYLDQVASKSGNMFTKVGHHGPAIENQWFALRIYFDKKGAIDVYSKQKPGLELRHAGWYPTKEQQRNGWGSDYYKVGKTVGLGGIKLWDGEKILPLNPVTQRIAKVGKDDTNAIMEMHSQGIPYKGQKIDVILRVTVYANNRMAKVEAFSQSGVELQFVTGINYHKDLMVQKGTHYIATWGIHPEDVALEKVAVGAAIFFDEDDFDRQLDDGKQHLLISKPMKLLETWITTANEKEAEINSLDSFIAFLEKPRSNED